MDFVNGAANDVVRVYVDGTLVHTGTSWEDYFRDCEGNETRTVDSLLFRSTGTAAPANAGKGFLIDNVSISTGTGSTFSTGFEGTLPTAPAAPTGLTATPGDGKVDLSWTAPADNGASISELHRSTAMASRSVPPPARRRSRTRRLWRAALPTATP